MSIPTPYLIAAGLTAVVAGWVLSGDIIKGGRDDARPPTIAERTAEKERKLFKVQAQLFNAQAYVNAIEIRGSTEASGNVSIRSETMGVLATRHVKKGDFVAVGDAICTLKVGAREAMVQQRKAEMKKAQIDLDAALKLSGNGFVTDARVNENKAAMEAAIAALKSAEVELSRTTIISPIAGIVQDPFAKVGDMLQVGDVCATVIKPDTMTMIAQVSERFIGRLSIGDAAQVKTVTGQDVTGSVEYIAPSADLETRTFRIEIKLPNENGTIRDGVTATAAIELPAGDAHLLPASTLTLNDLGEIGVRTVNAENIVSFMPVKILDDNRNGMWISGLPSQVKIITRGQEYVIEGQQVDAVIKTAETSNDQRS